MPKSPSAILHNLMNRIFKTFLLWLVLAALPLQGMAAAIQASCGPAHHTAPASMPSHTHEGVVGSHSHDGAAAHDTSDTLSDVTASAADFSSNSSIDNHAVCSACAACCVGATAPPSGALLTPAYSSSETVVIAPTPLATGFVPAGLERPPKRFSA